VEICKGASVSLNEVEQRLCKHIAQARYQANRAMQVNNSKVGGQADDETDLEGVSAEVAFCKLAGIYPHGPMDVSPRSSLKGEDCLADVVINGKSIDVKATKYPQGKLLAVPWKSKSADVYVLMTGEFPAYTFRGCMAGNELIKKERIGNLGHGPTYIARQCELSDISDRH